MTLYNKKIKADSSKNGSITVAFDFGWHGIEDWTDIQTRWMQADATILAISSDKRIANLSLNALSFYRNRMLEVSANGVPSVQVAVPTVFTNVSVPISLEKGVNTMHLHVPEGCERPSDKTELSNPDSRCLSVAVQNLTIT